MRKSIICFILGGLFFSVVGVSANSYLYGSNQVSYTPTDSNWNASNVKDALNDLYSKNLELIDLINLGDATPDNICNGKTAIVQGKLVTGTAASSGMTITNLSFSAYLSSNGDGAQGAGVNNSMTFDVSNYKTVTFGTVITTQVNCYNTSVLYVDGVSVSSNAILDVSSKNTITIQANPTIYGNALQNRSGSVTISSITFK